MDNPHLPSDFQASTVTYQLVSPTYPLDDVIYPSIALCNLMTLRKSFIQTLLTDPALQKMTNFTQLSQLVYDYFITGNEVNLTSAESKIVNQIYASPVYEAYCQVHRDV